MEHNNELFLREVRKLETSKMYNQLTLQIQLRKRHFHTRTNIACELAIIGEIGFAFA
jgi:hypothetical protein